MKVNNRASLELFGCSLDKLKNKPYLEESEKRFLKSFNAKNPVSSNPCIVNKMAWLVENEFGRKDSVKNVEFNWSIYQNPNCTEIGTKTEMNAIKKAYDEYKKDSESRILMVEHNDKEEGMKDGMARMDNIEEVLMNIIPNKDVLLNTLLEMGYKKSRVSKTFVWNIVGDKIIENMLRNKEGRIFYPTKDPNGDINYGGNRFSMVEKTINANKGEDK